MSELAIETIPGSRSGERLIAHAWYDGELVAENLPISSWSISDDGGRQVRTQVSLNVTDVDGKLAPWAVSDPLGVGGARVQVIYEMTAGIRVPMGWFRVTSNDPVENWMLYNVTDTPTWVSGGATVPVQGDDLTRLVVMDDLLAPESPPSGATVLSEVARLCEDTVPVTVADSVTDEPVSGSLVYERARLDAIEDLLEGIGCTYRMTPDGSLEVYPAEQTVTVWAVSGGDEGVLVSVERSQSLDGLYNAAVSEGATEDGAPLVGRAFETGGPLAWNGPHGRYPVFHSATGLLKTQGAVDRSAASILAGRIVSRSVDLNVTCLPHPGIQSGDLVQVACPTISGVAFPLVGIVQSLQLTGSTSGVAPMTMTVQCSYEDVQAVAAEVRRAA